MKFSVEHLGLPSRDPGQLKDWYVTILGGKVMFQDRNTPPAFLVSMPGGLMIEICPGNFALEQTTDKKLNGWRHVALLVDSIEEAKAELEKRGVKFDEPINPAAGGGRVLFFRDPEGNLLHLVERPANWNGAASSKS